MSTADEQLYAKFGRAYNKDTVLFNDGDMSKEMYIIQAGSVKITKTAKDIEKVLTILEPGDFFGEMATLNNKPRSANAIVTEDSKLLVIDPDTFESMITNSNEVALRMIKKLAERIHHTDKIIEELLKKDNNSKVVNTLIRIAYDIGMEKEQDIEIKISLSKLVTQTGIDKKKIKRVVMELVKRRIVRVTPDALVVSSIDKMQKFLYFITKKKSDKI